MSQSIVPQGRLTALKYLPYKGLETSTLWLFTYWSQLPPETSLTPQRRVLGGSRRGLPDSTCRLHTHALPPSLTPRSSDSVSAHPSLCTCPASPTFLRVRGPRTHLQGWQKRPHVFLSLLPFNSLLLPSNTVHVPFSPSPSRAIF